MSAALLPQEFQAIKPTNVSPRLYKQGQSAKYQVLLKKKSNLIAQNQVSKKLDTLGRSIMSSDLDSPIKPKLGERPRKVISTKARMLLKDS